MRHDPARFLEVLLQTLQEAVDGGADPQWLLENGIMLLLDDRLILCQLGPPEAVRAFVAGFRRNGPYPWPETSRGVDCD